LGGANLIEHSHSDASTMAAALRRQAYCSLGCLPDQPKALFANKYPPTAESSLNG
jgi:hypothetical protein